MSTPVIDENRDMNVEDSPKLKSISFLDVMLIGADESKQTFGTWSDDENNRCALGAAALGAQKLGLM